MNKLILYITILFFTSFCFGQVQNEVANTILIQNAQIIDGTGNNSRTASVRLEGHKIIEIGNLQPKDEETVIDASGLVLSPGFIDTHSHHDSGIQDQRDAFAAVSQGITTIVVGQDGFSNFPLSYFFEKSEESPVAVNIASYSGHNSIRRIVLEADFQRFASPQEIVKMIKLLEDDLAAGAIGLSTGLEYDPGIYSNTGEVVALAKVASKAGGRYTSHIRSEDRNFWDAIDEVIRISREANIPAQISHIKLAMKSNWGQTNRLINLLDTARAGGVKISADIYPYEYWESTLTVLFPNRDFDNRESAKFALEELAPPEGLILSQFDPDPGLIGKSIAEIAHIRNKDAITTYMELIAESQKLAKETGANSESVIGKSMRDEDIAQLMKWPHINICSDGTLSHGHPRGFGAFTRVLGRFVGGKNGLTLEEAVHKMTGLSAKNLGIENRGIIKPDAYADLVLFNPSQVMDQASIDEPMKASLGIEKVWVNGEIVYTSGKTTGVYPGKIIRRPVQLSKY